MTHEREESRQNFQEAEPQSLRRRKPQRFAQGDGQAPLEWTPEFPQAGEAQEIHDQSLFDHGQPQAHLINPGGLDGALGRASNYWYYGQGSPEEKVADAAGALAHGIGAAQSFEDGNKRTAYHTARYFLHNNGYGYLSPVDQDDEELADHLIGHGEGTHSLEDTQALFRSRLTQARVANILDSVHDTLDPRVWEDPASLAPKLRKEHVDYIHETIYTALDQHGYDGMEKWLSLVLTGSLTTYQYSDESDCDISLFVDTAHFPEWSRAEMIGVMISNCDGKKLPGTPFPLQDFVVPAGITREDLYKPGLRSGYDLATGTWVVPPDRKRVHDVESEMNESYTIALENADKMDKLLRYEPEKAIQFWHQIHKRRQRDQKAGRGDYAPSNVTYKMLSNRGLFPRLEEASGEYIAHATPRDSSNKVGHTSQPLSSVPQDSEKTSQSQSSSWRDRGDGTPTTTGNDHMGSVHISHPAPPSTDESASAFSRPEPGSSFQDHGHMPPDHTSHSLTSGMQPDSPYTDSDSHLWTPYGDESLREVSAFDTEDLSNASSYPLNVRKSDISKHSATWEVLVRWISLTYSLDQVDAESIASELSLPNSGIPGGYPEPGPNLEPMIQEIAQEYGLELNSGGGHEPWDDFWHGAAIAKLAQYQNQLAQIAQAYNMAPMYDPNAHAAWDELAADSAQRAAQIRQQYNYSVTDDPEPYPDAQAMFDDMGRGNFVVSRAHSEHPIWTPEQNVDFRTVHDVLGHGQSGADFSWEGENKACGAHSPLLSPAAQRALFTECIAQTAYANHYGGFGPQKTAFLDEHSGLRGAAAGDGTLCHRHIRSHGRTH